MPEIFQKDHWFDQFSHLVTDSHLCFRLIQLHYHHQVFESKDFLSQFWKKFTNLRTIFRSLDPWTRDPGFTESGGKTPFYLRTPKKKLAIKSTTRAQLLVVNIGLKNLQYFVTFLHWFDEDHNYLFKVSELSFFYFWMMSSSLSSRPQSQKNN